MYELVKYYENDKPPFVVRKGVSLEQAQAYCNDAETSSMTAQPPKGCGGNEKKIEEWHKKKKHWFIGFRHI